MSCFEREGFFFVPRSRSRRGRGRVRSVDLRKTLLSLSLFSLPPESSYDSPFLFLPPGPARRRRQAWPNGSGRARPGGACGFVLKGKERRGKEIKGEPFFFFLFRLLDVADLNSSSTPRCLRSVCSHTKLPPPFAPHVLRDANWSGREGKERSRRQAGESKAKRTESQREGESEGFLLTKRAPWGRRRGRWGRSRGLPGEFR